jgi:hypothetical protein
MNFEDEKQSKFNAGVALAERIDSLQRALNAVRFNLRRYNIETETFNFKVFIDALDGLKMEAWSKLTKDERKELTKIKELIESTLRYLSPVESHINLHGEIQYDWDEKNFTSLEKILFIYERKIKEALDRHNFNSPNADDDDGL